MRAAAVIVLALVGLITHDTVRNDAPEVQPITYGHVFDPRPYLSVPTTTTTEPIVQQMSLPPYAERCPMWHDTVRAAGVTDDEFPVVMRIIYRESRCAAGAINDTKNRDGSIDYGLAQINDRTWCLPNRYSARGWLQERRIVSSCRDLLDPATNVRALVALMRYSRDRTGCAFTPWNLCETSTD